METFDLQENIDLICIDVPTFPNGIPEAFNKLSQLLPTTEDRIFYGISYMDEANKIVYKASVSTKTPDEAKQYNLETYTIKKGKYLMKEILDWMKNIPEIGNTFQEIIKDDRVDKNSGCVEWYKSDIKLICMAKTK